MPSKAEKPEKKAREEPGKEKKRSSPWKIIIPTVLAVIILIVIVIALMHKPQPPAIPANEAAKTIYEITEKDVFSDELRANVTGDTISVFGIKLGDKMAKVLVVMGEPDDNTSFPENGGIANLEYRQSLGLNQTGVLFRFENDTLTKISIYPTFNKYLKGETVINHTKLQIYDMFGIMDSEYQIKGKILVTRVFVYGKKGIEVLIDKDETGFSLIYPK